MAMSQDYTGNTFVQEHLLLKKNTVPGHKSCEEYLMAACCTDSSGNHGVKFVVIEPENYGCLKALKYTTLLFIITV
jgi:hypothetical protein